MAVIRSTDPILIGLLLAAVIMVVLRRRDHSPWARAFRMYVLLGFAIVLFRIVFYVLVGLKTSGTLLIDLPEFDLPSWAAGITIFGPVYLEGLLDSASGGLRLAAIVICFGAANSLANPKRVLRYTPSSLHHLGTALVIAVTIAPQLVTSFRRVRRAQSLRGLDSRGPRSVLSTLQPVLEDAMDTALELARSMDSRGYARGTAGSVDRWVSTALFGALLAAVVGTYGLLDGTAPDWMGVPLLLGGGLLAVGGSVAASRRVIRTRYRPDRWGPPEWLVVFSGLSPALLAAFAVGEIPGVFASMQETWLVVASALVFAGAFPALPAVAGGRR